MPRQRPLCRSSFRRGARQPRRLDVTSSPRLSVTYLATRVGMRHASAGSPAPPAKQPSAILATKGAPLRFYVHQEAVRGGPLLEADAPPPVVHRFTS